MKQSRRPDIGKQTMLALKRVVSVCVYIFVICIRKYSVCVSVSLLRIAYIILTTYSSFSFLIFTLLTFLYYTLQNIRVLYTNTYLHFEFIKTIIVRKVCNQKTKL